ncbi:MAG TPA: sulfatase-like hydrolase/transferase [Chloroflexota bacterium]|nr:sulfatase-like hydrolase/transferase [Chloroflexota bacterium]
MSERLNVLLITTDTSRCDTLSVYGNPHAISPHLDGLAREGVLFEQGHSPAPVCMPARCSLLTGVHTPVHGCIENGIGRRTDLTPFPDLLAAAGYTSIMVGKTHFGPIPDSFHVQHTVKGEKSSDAEDCYAEHLRRHGYARATRHPNPVPEELFCEAFLVDRTIQEIDRAVSHGGAPFFAFCSLLSPHGPLDPPGRWATAYDDRPLPPLNYVPGEERRHPRQLRLLLGLDEGDRLPRLADGTPDTAQIDARKRLYYGLAAYCDAQIGRLLRYLDEAGLRRNTLVIFTSDHGTQLYDHGFDDKHTFYDASWRVPLILSLPGTLPQGARRGFATWNDLTATILAAAGLESPSVQGFDLLGPLARGADSPRGCAVSVLYRSCALATPRWKLEYYLEDGTGRLFDRLADPLERHDRYDDPERLAVRQELLHALLTWRAELVDVQFLHEHTGGGGPVAVRAASHTRAIRGVDAEQRLNDRVAAIDSR